MIDSDELCKESQLLKEMVIEFEKTREMPRTNNHELDKGHC